MRVLKVEMEINQHVGCMQGHISPRGLLGFVVTKDDKDWLLIA